MHFFDIHFLEEHTSVAPQRIESEANRALRLALILGTEVLVPNSSYCESALAKRLLDRFRGTECEEILRLVGSGGDIREFAEEKRAQYPAGSAQAEIYSKPLVQSFAWHRRTGSSSADIASGWLELTGSPEAELIAEVGDTALTKQILRKWRDVPAALGKSAFIVPHIAPLLVGDGQNVIFERRTSRLINGLYFGSFGTELKAGVIQGLAYLGDGNPIPSGSPTDDLRYDAFVGALRRENILKLIEEIDPKDLRSFFDDERFRRAFEASQTLPHYPPDDHRRRVEAIIINALPKETRATLEVLLPTVFGKPTRRSYRGDHHFYYELTLKTANGATLEIVVAHPSAMGKSHAAATAQAAWSHYATKLMLVVGIAGACPNPVKAGDHVRLGDVVVATHVFEHDNVKRHSADQIEFRDHPQKTAPYVAQLASNLQISPDQALPDENRSRITGFINAPLKACNSGRPGNSRDRLVDYGGGQIRHPDDLARIDGEPRVHLGLIATGDTLLKDAKHRDFLRDKFNTRAIDMETSAVRDVAHANGISLMAFRGTVDYCDGNKGDEWQIYASVAAAAVARLFLETLPKEWT